MPMFDGSAGNFLLQKIGLRDLPKQESIQQTQDRMTGVGSISDQDLERLNTIARRAGYRNYEEFKLREFQNSQRSQPTTVQRARGAVEQGARNAMALHPKELFNYVAGKIRDAVGN